MIAPEEMSSSHSASPEETFEDAEETDAANDDDVGPTVDVDVDAAASAGGVMGGSASQPLSPSLSGLSGGVGAPASAPPVPSAPPPSTPQSQSQMQPWNGEGEDDDEDDEAEAAPGAYAKVQVTDPQVHGEGRSRYTMYHLIVHSSTPDTKPAEVNRRYSDFQWLYRRLLTERPGAIVPLIPHMKALTQESRFREEVVSYRRTSCEVWINRIIRHPELHVTPSLAAFLKSEDELFASAKRSGDVDFADRGDVDVHETMEWGGSSTTSSSSGNNKSQRFRRIKALATKVKVAVRATSELERSDDEPAFEEINAYAMDLDTQVGWLSKHASALIKTYKDQHTQLETLGNKFAAVGGLDYPNTHSSNSARLSKLLNKIGDGLSALGLNEMKRHGELVDKFEHPIQDLVRDVQSLKAALNQRKEAQVKYTDRVNKANKLTAGLENVRNNPRDDPNQQEVKEKDAENALFEAREAERMKKSEFEAVSARVLREVERFRTQFRDSVRGAVKEWANVQREYYGKANKGWDDILPFLDAPELVSGDAGGGYSLSAMQQNGAGGGVPMLDSV